MHAGSPTNTSLSPELLSHMAAIRKKAVEYGLDFHDVVYEVLPFDTMNQIASYGGFPVRYPHWRWGMEYESLSKRDAYGLGRIYEMVINNDPCYAYLQESNSVTDQKLVMAHVFGHADFFKNNLWFSRTNRKMIDEMANHSTRVRRHVERHGQDTVERFIDLCLSIETLIDPHSMYMQRTAPARPAGHKVKTGVQDLESAGEDEDREQEESTEGSCVFRPEKLPAKDYMDPFINPAKEIERQRRAFEERNGDSGGHSQHAAFPERPTRDVLMFLLKYAPLQTWQHDVLSIVREESYYFAPQAMTKVMNEGWAVYWHSKLMTQHFLEAKEIIQYADQHSGVLAMPAGGFNPYKIGYELFRDVERRWDKGQHGSEWERLDSMGAREAYDDGSRKGREKIFQARRIYNDVSFIDEFLTPEFVERHRMYQYRRDPQSGEMKVVSRDFERIKQTLLYRLTNMGQPFIYVVDGNYLNRGELYMAHQWNGLDLDLARAREVLTSLRRLWGRPVHLHARIEDERFVLTCEAPEQFKKQKVSTDTPAPMNLA